MKCIPILSDVVLTTWFECCVFIPHIFFGERRWNLSNLEEIIIISEAYFLFFFILSITALLCLVCGSFHRHTNTHTSHTHITHDVVFNSIKRTLVASNPTADRDSWSRSKYLFTAASSIHPTSSFSAAVGKHRGDVK